MTQRERKLLCGTLLLAATLLLHGSEVTVRQGKHATAAANTLRINEKLSISNGLNDYDLSYVQMKFPPKTQLRLFGPRPKGGFSRPVMDFFRMSVNGISGHLIQPKEGDVTNWTESGRAGGSIQQRFDGVKLRLDWYMRKDSPVLWCTVSPQKDSLDTIRNLSIVITCEPSTLKADRKGVIWSGVYHRQVQTNKRLIEQSQTEIPALPGETMFVMQDSELDGSSPEKGSGPCIFLTDGKNVEKILLKVKNGPFSWITVHIKPDFRQFRFGVWQRRAPVTNAETRKMLQEHPEWFQFE